MSAEALIFASLSPLVSGRVYPDVAPSGAALPRIVYQQIGGQAIAYTEGSLSTTENGVVQVACWAATRQAAITLMQQAEAAILANASMQAEAIGARVSVFEEDTQLYGCRQDFDCWTAR